MAKRKPAPKGMDRALQIELAHRSFWHYCKLRVPKMYKGDRLWLKDMCDRVQCFWEKSDRQFLVINLPPRHCKSLTGQLFTEWVFGRHPLNQVITCSYNERLATLFAKKVRNAIQTPAGMSKRIEFGDVFPGVGVSKGDAAADMWSIQGSPVPSYLATSPGGTAVGIGCNLMIVDDLIKNDAEALSESNLEAQADWFFNTMMTRLEGNDWKVVVIMQRWSTKDIAGRVLEAFDCEHVDYQAFKEVEGKRVFLCPEILDEKSYLKKVSRMSPSIAEAVYQQNPVDVQGRLYRDFHEYDPKEVRPKPGEYVYAVTDTADRGTDFLVSYVYVERDGDAFILDAFISDSPMEVTEVEVASMFDKWGVKVAFTEANNGGRLFARNVRRKMKNKTCIFLDKMQTTNKEARIIESSGWVQNYVWFPAGWRTMWPTLYMQIMDYNLKGKNLHDDAVDNLANLFDMCTRQSTITQSHYEGQTVYGDLSSYREDFQVGMLGSYTYDEEEALYW